MILITYCKKKSICVVYSAIFNEIYLMCQVTRVIVICTFTRLLKKILAYYWLTNFDEINLIDIKLNSFMGLFILHFILVTKNLKRTYAFMIMEGIICLIILDQINA